MSHHLYRHFDKDDRLLYIGESLSVLERTVSHRRNSEWFSKITKITLETFPSKEAAKQAEKLAIIAEKPIHNKAHNRTEDRVVSATIDQPANYVGNEIHLLDRYHAACFLGVPKQRLNRWAKSNYGPPRVVIDGQLFYRRLDLIEWVESLLESNVCLWPASTG